MDIGPLTVESHPTPADVQFWKTVCTSIMTHNRSLTGSCSAVHGCAAHQTSWSRGMDLGRVLLYSFSVHADCRGQGMAHTLDGSGTEAATRGCHRALLDTHSFQAPALYQHLAMRFCRA